MNPALPQTAHSTSPLNGSHLSGLRLFFGWHVAVIEEDEGRQELLRSAGCQVVAGADLAVVIVLDQAGICLLGQGSQEVVEALGEQQTELFLVVEPDLEGLGVVVDVDDLGVSPGRSQLQVSASYGMRQRQRDLDGDPRLVGAVVGGHAQRSVRRALTGGRKDVALAHGVAHSLSAQCCACIFCMILQHLSST